MSKSTIWRAFCGAVAAAAVATGLVVAGPAAPALADTARGAAFVWSYIASPDLNVPYTPDIGAYQYNSTSPGVSINTVTRVSTGQYVVRIPGLVGFGATHATAYGGDATYCNTGVTVASDSSLVDVICFKANGTRTDHSFTLSFTNTTESFQGRPLAYMEVESDGAVWASRHFNSAGGLSTVTRSGSQYVVRIPGLGAWAGHVQVSGADGQGSRCKVVGWGPSAADQLVYVQCWHAGFFGFPENAPFILTYVNEQNILGQPVGVDPAGHETAYAWAFDPASSSYSAVTSWQYSSSGYGATGTRTDVGQYDMTFPFVNMFNGNIQVTAYGPGQEFCNVAYWYDDAVHVRCFNWDGTPVDTRYTVAFTGSFAIGG